MLSIVIPTYKEAENVDILIPQIFNTLSSQISDLRVLIVDDDSQDGIENVIMKHKKVYGEGVQLITRKSEKGLANAWKDGIKQSQSPLVAIMDADLAHDPKELLRMVQEAEGVDMVIGSRYMPEYCVQMEGKAFWASLLSTLGQKICRFLLKITVNDMSHSFRVFKKSVGEKVLPQLQCDGNAMMVEFTFYSYHFGFSVKEIPIHYGKRLHGTTKLGVVREGLKFLKTIMILRRSLRKGPMS